MPLTHEQQAIELVSRASQILVVASEHPTVDALAAVSAVCQALTKLHKTFDVLIPGWDAKTWPPFLKPLAVRPSLGATRAFHVRVNVAKTPLAELRYDVKDGWLDVTLVPKSGEWTDADASFKAGNDRYDLVIAFGAPDLASLGTLAADHADFLLRTPILNLDCRGANESWGQVNLVDLNSVSVTETVYHWLTAWNKNFIDESVATALLAGMLAGTQGFRTANVTPKTLTASAELIELGADRQKIVHALWRTRSLGTLKLWGRALSRLEQDRGLGLVWSVLTEADGVESGAGTDALAGVVDDLIAYVPNAKIIALMVQDKNRVLVTLHALPPYSALDLARPFHPTGTRERVVFPYQQTASLTEATTEIIEKLRQILAGPAA